MPSTGDARNRAVDEMQMNEEQFGFELGEAASATVYSPDLREIREDLNTILTEARSATDQSPWDARTMRYNKIVFIQMAKWLPDDEAQQLCFEFLTEFERIEALLAA